MSEATIGWDAIPGSWGYRVRYRESGGSWIFDTTTTNSLTLTGLSTGASYQWRVHGICDSLGTNMSSWTSIQSFTTAICNISLSSSVTDATCNGGSTGSIDLTVIGGSGSYTYSWDNNSTSEDLSALSAGTYVVTVTDSWGCTETLSVVVGEGSAIVTNNPQSICNGGSYTINGNTYTSSGTYTDIFTAANGCDSTVTTVISISSSLFVSLTPSGPLTICNGLSATLFSSVTNTNYTYEWSDASGVISGATSSTYSVSVAGTYSLMITTPAGCSSTSNSVVVNVISVSTPGSLSTTDIQLDRATMNWGSVANADHYDLRVREQGTSTWTTFLANLIDTSRTKSGLSSATTYEWQVRSACSSDSSSVSAWTSSEVFTTLTPCTTPQNPNVSGIDTTSATIGWDAIPGSWGYRVRYKVVGGSWIFDTTTTNSLTLTGLNTGTIYRWQVQGMCDSPGSNMSGFTSNQYFTTLVPPASCNIPTGMISSAGLTNVALSWNSVSNGIQYDIRSRIQGTSTWTYLYNLNSTTRTINNLTSTTTYEWEIRTQCASSVSSWSSTLTFTTASGCTVPTNPDEQNIAITSADLIWDAISSAVIYRIKWRKIGGPLNVQFSNTNQLSLNGLDPGSNYKWRVMSECDSISSNISSFTSWQYFSTLSSIRITAGDTELMDNLNVYPNPTRGLFNISFTTEKIDNFEIIIVNAFGKLVSQEEKQDFIGEYTKQVDLSDYPRGIYMVQIRTNDSFVSKRVVVQ